MNHSSTINPLMLTLVIAISLITLAFPADAALHIQVVSQVEGKTIALNNAVVWATPANTGDLPLMKTKARGAEMEQRRRQFHPYILPVQVGVPVVFPNRDDTAHHVYSFSQSYTFEIPLYKRQLPEPIIFREPGIVPLGCNIHDWMIAYIVVVDTPYFDQLDNGKTVLTDIPPGTYRIHLWHPALDTRETTEQLVTYTGGESTLYFNLRYPVKKNAAQPAAPDARSDELDDY